MAVGVGRQVPVVAGLALAAAGLVAAALGLASGTDPLSVRSTGVVNADRPGLDAHNSPAAAAAPGRPDTVVVGDRIDSPRFSCSLHRSTDGGATWGPLPLPRAPDAPNCFWPDVAFDGDGRLLVLTTATGGRYNQPVGAWLQRFDGTSPDGVPVRVAPSEAFHAHLATSPGSVVVAWVQAPPENAEQPLGLVGASNPVVAARSTDGGRTWSRPVVVSEPGRRAVHPVVVAGAGGALVVAALDLVDDRENYEGLHQGQAGPTPAGRWEVVAWRSTDGGASFGPGVTVAEVDIPERVIVDLMGGPSLAAGPGGTPLYLAWDGGQGEARDVHLARSDDGGTTWGPPSALERPGEQLLPAVGVAPDGRVDLVFYDRGRDPTGTAVEAVVASSGDGGRRFDSTVVSPAPFDGTIGLGSSQGLPQRGNQLALVSEPDRVLAFWGDASRGTVDDNLQDLAFAQVAVGEGGRAWLLVAGGLFLAVAGAVMAARAGRRAAGS